MASPHIVLFPFMSKGHTIPILHLARLLLRRGATVTIFTTPRNRPFISNSLSNTNATIVDLPFPEHIDGVPVGVESTDKLPSMSLFFPFVTATKLMKPDFEKALGILPHITFMVTDGFFCWTLDSASNFGIPRLVYYGMNNFALTVARNVMGDKTFKETEPDDELVPVPDFPRIKVTKNDFEPSFRGVETDRAYLEFLIETGIATSKSYGLVADSFHELEPVYADFWNCKYEPKSWCVGPLCLAEPPRVDEPPSSVNNKPPWMQWLDQKLEQGKSVLYVAFGSQAEVSAEQFREIKIGLEKSEVNFLWVVRRNESELSDGYEERVKDRGIVVREWVDQMEILKHQGVQGFLSHCGWNSVMESICAKVPILAWPMMAEQPLNARLVVEEVKIGLRVETCNGSVRGFVKWEGLMKMVKELMEGEMGKEVRKKVKELGEAASNAVQEGGSSWQSLNELVDELHATRNLSTVK